jgi:formate hydrogenlyase subunit 3/multisubunit Na+/H+ antiporter MnhD subunit
MLCRTPGLGGQMRVFLKLCSMAVMVLLVIMALGPEQWTPRTGIGWEFDHFAGYFAITTFVCLAWPRPMVVGGALMAFGAC